MFYVATMPALTWAIVLLATLGWLTIAYRRHRAILFAPLPYVFALGQGAVAGLALYLTAQNSISMAACMTGMMGAQASMLLILVLLGTLFAFLIAARGRLLMVLNANRSFVIAFAVLQIVVTLILMRSAMLCTV
ncbi:hypothetical protein QTO30_11900 [Yoonia sp. GPGPB17]|uniref:hypothetical protein n=1 Tax=Yoonia sp. GPGPB17 TaxID=3026147 RepID=UPI0030C1D0E1